MRVGPGKMRPPWVLWRTLLGEPLLRAAGRVLRSGGGGCRDGGRPGTRPAPGLPGRVDLLSALAAVPPCASRRPAPFFRCGDKRCRPCHLETSSIDVESRRPWSRSDFLRAGQAQPREIPSRRAGTGDRRRRRPRLLPREFGRDHLNDRHVGSLGNGAGRVGKPGPTCVTASASHRPGLCGCVWIWDPRRKERQAAGAGRQRLGTRSRSTGVPTRDGDRRRPPGAPCGGIPYPHAAAQSRAGETPTP